MFYNENLEFKIIKKTSNNIYFYVFLSQDNMIDNKPLKFEGFIDKEKEIIILENEFVMNKFKLIKNFFKKRLNKKRLSMVVLSVLASTAFINVDLQASEVLVDKHIEQTPKNTFVENKLFIKYDKKISIENKKIITLNIKNEVQNSVRTVIKQIIEVINDKKYKGDRVKALRELKILTDNIKIKISFGDQLNGRATLQDFSQSELEKNKDLIFSNNTDKETKKKQHALLLKNAAIELLLPFSGEELNRMVSSGDKSLYYMIYNMVIHEATHITGAAISTSGDMLGEKSTILMQRKYHKNIKEDSFVKYIINKKIYNKKFFTDYEKNLGMFFENTISVIKSMKQDNLFDYLSDNDINNLQKVFNNTFKTLQDMSLEEKQENTLSAYNKRKIEPLYIGYFVGTTLQFDENHFTQDFIEKIDSRMTEDSFIKNNLEKESLFYKHFKLRKKGLMIALALEIENLDLSDEEKKPLDIFISKLTGFYTVHDLLSKSNIQETSLSHRVQAKMLNIKLNTYRLKT